MGKSANELKLAATPIKERTPKKEAPQNVSNITVDSPLFNTPCSPCLQSPASVRPTTISNTITVNGSSNARKKSNTTAAASKTPAKPSSSTNANVPNPPRLDPSRMERIWEKNAKEKRQQILHKWKPRIEELEDMIKKESAKTPNTSFSEVEQGIETYKRTAADMKEKLGKLKAVHQEYINELDDNEFRAHRKLMMIQITHQELEKLVPSTPKKKKRGKEMENAVISDMFKYNESLVFIRKFYSVRNSQLDSLIPFEIRLNRICDIYADLLGPYANHVSITNCFVSRASIPSEKGTKQKGLFVLQQSTKLLEKIKQRLDEKNKMFFPHDASNKSWNRYFKNYENRLNSLKGTVEKLCTSISNEEPKYEELRNELNGLEEESEKSSKELSTLQTSYDSSVVDSPSYTKAVKDGELLRNFISKTKERNKNVLEQVTKAKNDKTVQLLKMKNDELEMITVMKEMQMFKEELESAKNDHEEKQKCHDVARKMLHLRSKKVLYEEEKKEELNNKLKLLRQETAFEKDQLQMREYQRKSICRKLKYFVRELKMSQNKTCKIALLNDSEDLNIKSLVLC